MKKVVSVLLFSFLFLFSNAQHRQLSLTLGQFDDNVNIGRNAADSALMIASYIYNSKEFQDSVSHLTFSYRNRCSGAKKSPIKPDVNGNEIIDSLFKRTEIKYNLTLLNENKRGLGYTCPESQHTFSRYGVILQNMVTGSDLTENSKLPFNYAYAVHICHEYSHDVGFCHWRNKPNVKDEVSEAIGEIAYCYALKFYHEHAKITR
jgi:hypothetical protein